MKYLRPLILTDSLYTPIEKIINQIFDQILFAPLRAAVFEIQNAQVIGLERALREGKVWHVESRIYGTFNASISKELKGMGAVFDKRTKSWTLPGALPARLQMAIAQADSDAQNVVDRVIRVLDDIHPDDQTPEQLKEQYGKVVFRMNEDFIDATKAVAIAPELTAHAQQVISEQWAQNLDLYIKGWVKDAIFDLRQDVQSHVFTGGRAAGLVKSIQSMHNVSKEKAKFLARQETSLLMSKLREERYTSIGVRRYKWNGVADARERPDHKVLNGKIFTWDRPPITNQRTGARNNPGEDFGCRCLAIPILYD